MHAPTNVSTEQQGKWEDMVWDRSNKHYCISFLVVKFEPNLI